MAGPILGAGQENGVTFRPVYSPGSWPSRELEPASRQKQTASAAGNLLFGCWNKGKFVSHAGLE